MVTRQLYQQWYYLAVKLNKLNFNDEKDQLFCKWTTSRNFTAKSVYEHMTKDDSGPSYRI
jgi:hypothetical protein